MASIAHPSAIPNRSSPAAARKVASTSPANTRLSRVATLPRIGTAWTSGRRRSNCAVRRGEEVPTRAPCDRAASETAPINRSRTSARSRQAAMTSATGRSLSTSFNEWTEAWVVPASSARSSSLVHRALPPISASGRSWMRSPMVRISWRTTLPVSQPCAASSAAATMRAWARARGEALVPRIMRIAISQRP